MSSVKVLCSLGYDGWGSLCGMIPAVCAFLQQLLARSGESVEVNGLWKIKRKQTATIFFIYQYDREYYFNIC